MGRTMEGCYEETRILGERLPCLGQDKNQRSTRNRWKQERLKLLALVPETKTGITSRKRVRKSNRVGNRRQLLRADRDIAEILHVMWSCYAFERCVQNARTQHDTNRSMSMVRSKGYFSPHHTMEVQIRTRTRDGILVFAREVLPSPHASETWAVADGGTRGSRGTRIRMRAYGNGAT